jgi:LPPG:FO 2-phospho-L-lactate transferase
VKIVALSGGVGAAKFLSGLVRILPPEDLTVVVNTGDDFYWMGLYVCPDLDTITYTLANMADPQTGWGVRGDTYTVLDRLKALGCDDWFKVGDIDLATHLYRTEQLQNGTTLTAITGHIGRQNGIRCRILPMTDSSVPTLVHTDEGTLLFQDYFVRMRCEPSVISFTFHGIEKAVPAPGVLEALESATGIIICPSNPFISIGPILAVPGLREALCKAPAKVLAITPIIAGEAVKGPTATMLAQLGMKVSAASVASFYGELLDIFVLDHRDEKLQSEISAMGCYVRCADTLMNCDATRLGLARSVLEIFR